MNVVKTSTQKNDMEASYEVHGSVLNQSRELCADNQIHQRLGNQSSELVEGQSNKSHTAVRQIIKNQSNRGSLIDLTVENNNEKISSIEGKGRAVGKIVNRNKRKLQCEQCTYTTILIGNMSRHKRRVHGDIQISCSQCSKAFKDPYELKGHVRSIHEKIRLLCEICSSEFNTRQSLRRHRIMLHSDSTPFLCNVCGQKFFENRSYQGHMNKHMKVKPFTCSICNKDFAYRYCLERHILVCNNKDVDKYKCTICQKQLKSAACLQEHMKGVHDPKVYTCACGKSFSWKSALLRHQKSCPTANWPRASSYVTQLK